MFDLEGASLPWTPFVTLNFTAMACLVIMPTIVGFVCSGRIVLFDILKYCHSEFLSLKFVDQDILLLV